VTLPLELWALVVPEMAMLLKHHDATRPTPTPVAAVAEKPPVTPADAVAALTATVEEAVETVSAETVKTVEAAKADAAAEEESAEDIKAMLDAHAAAVRKEQLAITSAILPVAMPVSGGSGGGSKDTGMSGWAIAGCCLVGAAALYGGYRLLDSESSEDTTVVDLDNCF